MYCRFMACIYIMVTKTLIVTCRLFAGDHKRQEESTESTIIIVDGLNFSRQNFKKKVKYKSMNVCCVL